MSQHATAPGSLAAAVEAFASLLQQQPDSALERAWAWGAYDSEGVRFALFRTYEQLRGLAVRVAAERTAQEQPISPAQQILAQYHTAYRDLQASLLGLPDGTQEQAPAEGEWTLRQVLAHVVGADIGFYVATRYALDRHRSGESQPAKIPDSAWNELIPDAFSVDEILDGPLEGILAYHEALHQRILKEFAGISADELSIPSLYWEGYELPLRFRLHRFDSHLRQHTVQVDKALASLGRAPTEAKRILRLVYAALAEAEGTAIGAWDLARDVWHETAEEISARTGEIAGLLA